MTHLRLLGSAALLGDGEVLGGAAAHRYSLALLALLACAPGHSLSRGKLVGLLWPASPERSARSRLNTYVHRLRGKLADDTLVSRGSELWLNPNRMRSDVVQFRKALADGKPQQAVELYRGPFLDGFWIDDSPEFEQWTDRERSRLQDAYRNALETMAREAWEEGTPEVAAGWWERRIREDPYDSRIAVRLMEALQAAGNRAGALKAGVDHVRLLKEDFGTAPSEEVWRVMDRLRQASRPEEVSGPEPPPPKLDPHAIAVLPFEDLARSDEGSAFAAGLHHDLLTRLSRVHAFTVISRTSVLRYGDGSASIPEIARRLGVGTVVEGSVQVSGHRVRLNVQTIDVASDGHRWAETFDRRFTEANVFEIQTDLAEKITRGLRAELTGQEQVRVARPPSAELDVYLSYVQGRTHLSRRSPSGFQRALEYFERALERDDIFAPAWAGMAETLALIRWYGHPWSEAYPDLMEPARRALELDPELGEAHTSMGIIRAWRQEGPAAVQELERAAELDPADPEAHNWLGWMRMVLGRPEAGIRPAERSAELDPMAPYTRVFLAHVYLAAGRYQDALLEATSARELQPEYWVSHFMEGLSLHHLGRFGEARFLLKEALAGLEQGSGVPLADDVRAALAVTRAAAGEEDEARELLSHLQDRGNPAATGLALAALGEVDEAFTAFHAVDRWGVLSTPMIRHLFPKLLGPLRDDSRFESILEAVDISWGLDGGRRAGLAAGSQES
jgi:DNA-binding SARP family transcriptional activator/TolB-like protein/Flp pilus assembly protein TadD